MQYRLRSPRHLTPWSTTYLTPSPTLTATSQPLQENDVRVDVHTLDSSSNYASHFIILIKK